MKKLSALLLATGIILGTASGALAKNDPPLPWPTHEKVVILPDDPI